MSPFPCLVWTIGRRFRVACISCHGCIFRVMRDFLFVVHGVDVTPLRPAVLITLDGIEFAPLWKKLTRLPCNRAHTRKDKE